MGGSWWWPKWVKAERWNPGPLPSSHGQERLFQRFFGKSSLLARFSNTLSLNGSLILIVNTGPLHSQTQLRNNFKCNAFQKIHYGYLGFKESNPHPYRDLWQFGFLLALHLQFESVALLPCGSPFGDPAPHGDLFQILGPQKVSIFLRSPLSPFQAEERAKSQSSHYLLNVDNLNTCDDKTSFNLYTCTSNEATLCEGVFLKFFSSVFQGISSFR